MNVQDISIAKDQTYHIYQGKPFYPQRFIWVLKYHTPGLAPVGDESGAYHITLEGLPAYKQRYIRTFGYYYDRAAVVTNNGWTHINPTGNLIYSERYLWVGNYQDSCCTVRDSQGYYFHINLHGKRLYPEHHLYAGDFRDRIAVVRLKNNLCTHINTEGNYIHKKELNDLDVYHKDFARARDKQGWFHIDLEGNSIYEERFLLVEPFYNGQALAHRYNGQVGIIDEQGTWIHTIKKRGIGLLNNNQNEEELEQNWKELSSLLIGNWTTQTIGAAVRLGIIEALIQCPMTLETITNTLKIEKNACERLLRALIGLKIVRYSNKTFILTRRGELLKEDHKWSLAKPALLWSEEHYSAWEGVSISIQTGKPYFEKKYSDSYFEWLANNPEKCLVYHEALESYAEHDYRYIPNLYDFSGHMTVLDVGGGSGNLLKRILKKYPANKGVLFERPELASLAHKKLTIAGLEGRYKVISGNFFDEIPKRGDIILLARVLHDWDDLRALIILKNCSDALPPRGRLLIIELLLPPTLDSGFGALLNLNLLVMTGGKERTLDEYKHLLEDTGFEFKTIIPTPSVSTIIVAEKKEM